MAYQDEKAEEKQEEKRAEKGPEEKGWGEKDWRRDALGGSIWALILIWAGAMFLLVTLDLTFLDWLDWGNVWGAILLGAGVLIGAEIVIRLLVPSHAQPLRGRIVLATILIILGISALTDVMLWPLILIAVGFSILFQAFFQRPR